jgi:predicted Zn finger-like uncharacterized protein
VYTRCPGCHTVHPVNAALLAGGAGRYRCGKCNKVSNALESLFDEWPTAGARAPAADGVPVLGLPLDLEHAAQAGQAPTENDADSEEPAAAETGGPATRRLLRAAWITGAILILLVSAWQWAKFHGASPLQDPTIESALQRLGLETPPPAQPFRDLESIHLVNRELRSHPVVPGRLRLSATIVNRAQRSQPYPAIEVALLDAAGQVVLRERFDPSDYLAVGSAPDGGMAPQAYLPLTLELADPGSQAVGFELEFR